MAHISLESLTVAELSLHLQAGEFEPPRLRVSLKMRRT